MEVEAPENIHSWLYQCIEVETSFKYYEKTEDEHKDAIKAMVADGGNSFDKLEDIAIVVEILGEDESFDFDSVSHRPLPIEVESHPVVFTVFYKPSVEKCFAKFKTDLQKYDGVTCLHGVWNILEYLESGEMSPYPFTSRREPLPENQFENFQAQMARVAEGKSKAESHPDYGTDKWFRNPSMGQIEESMPDVRPARRFTETSLSYKEAMKKIDEIKEMLDIPFYALTVNYSPNVVLSLCPTLEEATNKKSIASNVCFPPEGVGTPPPMNAGHIEALFNTIFLNNYGSHSPKISGRVVGHIWDWAGFYTSFVPFFFLGTIQGKLFLSYSASPDDFEAIEKSGILDGTGTSVPYRYHDFYVRGE